MVAGAAEGTVPHTGPFVKVTDGRRWARQRATHMSISLAVGPAPAMHIGHVGRRKTLKRRTQAGNPFNLRSTINKSVPDVIET